MKKNIIYVDNFLSKHGFAPTIAEVLVKQLRLEGYDIICTSSVKQQATRLADMLATIYKHRKKAVALIAVYSTSAFYFACACAWLCRRLGITYIPCLHGGNLPERIKKSPSRSKKLFGGAYLNVAVSGYLQQPMQQNGWPCTVIPNPVNIGQYPFKERASCTPRLLWVRSFHQLYNPQLAIQVLGHILKEYSDATLVMVGPDKDGSLAQVTLLAKELGLGQRVEFKGFLSKQEWITLSAVCDIFINTTNFDNLPVSVIEAMALGMPIVSTNVGGLPWLIEDGVTGLLVPPGDETAFANAVMAIVNKPLLAASLSENARMAAEGYDWKTVRVLWNRLLESVL